MYADPESRTDCVASNGHRNARHMRAARAAVYFPVSCACAQKGHNSQMERATVSRLKNSLSAYLRKVRAGHSVVVYDRDIPIARIDRIEDGARATTGLRCSPLRASLGLPKRSSRPSGSGRCYHGRWPARCACWMRCSMSASKDAHASIMRFWDSSALISLLIDEPVHEVLMGRLDEDPQLLVWWGGLPWRWSLRSPDVNARGVFPRPISRGPIRVSDCCQGPGMRFCRQK